MSTLFLLMKYLHILGVIVWVGGAFALVVLNARLAGAEPAARAAMGQQSEAFGRSVLGPAMVVTLLAGLGAAGSIGYPFTSLWIVWGIVGLILAIVIGVVLVGRTASELGTVARSAGPGDPRVAALSQRLTVLNRLMLLILASVVYAMVFKPTI